MYLCPACFQRKMAHRLYQNKGMGIGLVILFVAIVIITTSTLNSIPNYALTVVLVGESSGMCLIVPALMLQRRSLKRKQVPVAACVHGSWDFAVNTSFWEGNMKHTGESIGFHNINTAYVNKFLENNRSFRRLPEDEMRKGWIILFSKSTLS